MKRMKSFSRRIQHTFPREEREAVSSGGDVELVWGCVYCKYGDGGGC